MRFAVAGTLALIAWISMPSDLTFATRTLASWDTAGFSLLILGWAIARRETSETRRRAAARDAGRTFVWTIALCASSITLVAAIILVHQRGFVWRFEGTLLRVLCVTTVAVSWLLTHTAFALRYAHLYDEGDGGLEFPGKEKPDDLDFAYFAFTIGMCFQVSDCVITRRSLRRTALVHALLSFAYNTVLFALAVNLIIGR